MVRSFKLFGGPFPFLRAGANDVVPADLLTKKPYTDTQLLDTDFTKLTCLRWL